MNNKREEPKRLPPKEETIKLLLLRSGNECAFPGCNRHLFNDENTLVAECCHIESALPGGERFNENQTNEERRSYDNLIFFCHEHHVETDDFGKFTAETLKNFKKEHESKFSEKPFEIKPGYVDQVLGEFEELKNIVKENLEISKSIAEGQKVLTDILQQNQKEESADAITAPQFQMPANTNFVGREKELKTFGDAIAKYTTLQIAGISGVGKTSFLVKALEENTGILWIDCSVIDKSVLLYSVGAHLAEKLNKPDLLNNLRSSSSSFATSLGVASKSLEESGLFVVLDNVNDRLSEFADVIKEFNRIFKSARIIFTSNSDISPYILHNQHFSLTLIGLGIADTLKLIKVSSGPTDLSDKDLTENLLELTQGHPYMIKLVAVLCQQMPLDLLLTEFRKLPESEVNAFVRRKIFESLSTAEQDMLIDLSALHVSFRLEGLKSFDNNPDSLKVFLALVGKYLITLENKAIGSYYVHDLIRIYIESSITDDRAKERRSKAIRYLESLDIKGANEWIDLINLALKDEDNETAKGATHTFLSGLLASGYFHMAHDLASEMTQDPRTKDWDFIYYVIGRVNRFQGDFKNAIEAYEKGAELSSGLFKNILLMELAAVLFNYSDAKRDKQLFQRSVDIYEQMRVSDDPEAVGNAYGCLGSIKAKKGKHDEALADLETALEILKKRDNPKTSIASVYQTMGDCHSKMKDYPKALYYYSLSLKDYEKNMVTWRANVFEGLYYLYASMGWTHAKLRNYGVAAAYFLLALKLATQYQIPRKVEKSLFDYSYNLLLAGEYAVAADNLYGHYEMIVNAGTVREWDPNLIFGALAMANWYAGRVTMALAFIGTLINFMKLNQKPHNVTFEHDDVLDKKVDIFELFKKQNYVFLLTGDYTFDDLRLWINELLEKRPELSSAFENILTNDSKS